MAIEALTCAGSVDRDACPSIVDARATRDLAAVQLDDLPAHVEADACAPRARPILGLMVFEAKELVEDP